MTQCATCRKLDYLENSQTPATNLPPSHQEILERYAGADAHTRLNLYMTYRGLREEFIRLERESD